MSGTSGKDWLPGIAGGIFLITAASIVVSSWAADLHKYDLSLSFSRYAGLRKSTAVLYFLSAVIMLVLLSIYVAKTRMTTMKKVMYALIFLCIFGTALFPCNRQQSVLSSDIHDVFAVCLMLSAALSFVLTAVFSKRKLQRFFGTAFTIYAACFIIGFFGGSEIMDRTFFIWEIAFIYLLILELHVEKYGEIRSNDKLIGIQPH